jgi:hypothetical protein
MSEAFMEILKVCHTPPLLEAFLNVVSTTHDEAWMKDLDATSDDALKNFLKYINDLATQHEQSWVALGVFSNCGK